MAVATIGLFRVSQGRDQELLKILGAAKAVNESLGSKALVRRTIFGGENAAAITFVGLYESAESHAAFSEKLREQEDHPLRIMNQSPNPPATLLARSMALEITPKLAGFRSPSRSRRWGSSGGPETSTRWRPPSLRRRSSSRASARS